MTLLAAIRPDDWNFPLFLHLVGAMTLVGALLLVAVSLAGAGQGGPVATLRLGFRGLLFAAIPAWIVMRVSAEWLASKENVDDDSPAWVDIGYMTSDTSFLLLIAATVCAGLAARRAGRDQVRGGGLSVAVVVLTAITLVAYVVVIWAMTTKPT
jgi:phosphoglycerol transferase MdoB-like AlkP superfamily enzyme